MTDLNYWVVFFSAVLALNLSPGPDLLYIVSRTVAQGRKVGLASAAGLWVGATVHAVAVALGLSALLVASAKLFLLVKYVGAAYLVYLGIQALRSKGTKYAPVQDKGATTTPARAFRQGILVDLLNPKVAIFFMAFLPQFVRPNHGHPSLQLLVLGVLVILVAIPVETSCVLAASRTTDFLRRNPRTSVWLERMLGTVLVALGVRLAISELAR